MARGSINRAMLRTTISSSFKRSKAKEIAYQRAREVFRKKKSDLLKEFNNHPVTREIDAGPDAGNSSGTLGGYGNLYSFIGFPGGDPIGAVRDALTNSIHLYKTPVIKIWGGGRVAFTFRGTMPDRKDLERAAPMPWEPGSWLFKIETGISGLGSYLYGRMYTGSRSGSGIQSKRQARSATFTPLPYISYMLENFKK